MAADDALIGEALSPSPYEELRTKYEALREDYREEIARERRSYARLRAVEEAYELLLTKYEELSAECDDRAA